MRAKEFREIMSHPDWKFDRYCASNNTLSLTYWIGNGWLSFSGYDGLAPEIPMFKRHLFWRIMNKERENKVIIKTRAANATIDSVASEFVEIIKRVQA